MGQSEVLLCTFHHPSQEGSKGKKKSAEGAIQQQPQALKHKTVSIINGYMMYFHQLPKQCYAYHYLPTFTNESCTILKLYSKNLPAIFSMYFCTGKRQINGKVYSLPFSVCNLMGPKYTIHYNLLFISTFLAVMEVMWCQLEKQGGNLSEWCHKINSSSFSCNYFD